MRKFNDNLPVSIDRYSRCFCSVTHIIITLLLHYIITLRFSTLQRKQCKGFITKEKPEETADPDDDVFNTNDSLNLLEIMENSGISSRVKEGVTKP